MHRHWQELIIPKSRTFAMSLETLAECLNDANSESQIGRLRHQRADEGNEPRNFLYTTMTTLREVEDMKIEDDENAVHVTSAVQELPYNLKGIFALIIFLVKLGHLVTPPAGDLIVPLSEICPRKRAFAQRRSLMRLLRLRYPWLGIFQHKEFMREFATRVDQFAYFVYFRIRVRNGVHAPEVVCFERMAHFMCTTIRRARLWPFSLTGFCRRRYGKSTVSLRTYFVEIVRNIYVRHVCRSPRRG